MKKILMLVACAAMVCGAAQAQGIKFGAKAGLNVASMTNDSDAKFRPAFYVGGLAEYGFSDKFAVQADLVYSLQGTTGKVGGVRATMSTHYLNIPIVAKYSLIDKLSVELGPQFGFLLSAKAKVSGNGASASNGMTELCNTVDVSLPIGLSYGLTDNIAVNARYVLGLTGVLKDVDSSDNTRNSVIQIGVSYYF